MMKQRDIATTEKCQNLMLVNHGKGMVHTAPSRYKKAFVSFWSGFCHGVRVGLATQVEIAEFCLIEFF